MSRETYFNKMLDRACGTTDGVSRKSQTTGSVWQCCYCGKLNEGKTACECGSKS